MTTCLSRSAFASLFLVTALLAACAGPSPSAQRTSVESAADATISVEFINASEFAEMRSHRLQRDSDSKAWMESLRKHLEQQAPQYLPPKTHLLVQLTDIKLAGEYEPWRRAGLYDVRIVRDIYPPRIDLNYQLSNNQGQTFKDGNAKLRDSAFLMRAHGYHDDPLRYEKTLLDDWLRREFKTE
ncbi:DUF3016 domain-containing protein [Paenalcaligenes niemegkensis]|uniref:DUF3016 domain-containing protein n=1 Tax=Paenalcaligenes niemegkensis TaxID=2895469 RepID=UPI001EE7E021|nr:DUF3016 domain-containing protein [Paenalcaligenes niemegkensis]MCQ9616376.1 DUF3016 domain-containing protein [Paenalcaligenes niemegkensis]